MAVELFGQRQEQTTKTSYLSYAVPDELITSIHGKGPYFQGKSREAVKSREELRSICQTLIRRTGIRRKAAFSTLLSLIQNKRFTPELLPFINRLVKTQKEELIPLSIASINQYLSSQDYNAKEFIELMGTFTDNSLKNGAIPTAIILRSLGDTSQGMNIIKKSYIYNYLLGDGVGGVVQHLGPENSPEKMLKKLITAIKNIKSIGEEQALLLRNEFNIISFERYSVGTLKRVLSLVKNKNYLGERPLAVFVMPYYDKNGGFSEEEFSKQIERVSKNNRLLIIEAGDDITALKLVAKIADKYGQISNLMVGGHGSFDSGEIALGRGISEDNYLDIGDGNKLKIIGPSLRQGATIIFLSCEAGKQGKGTNIASLFKRVLGDVTVIAPTEVAGSHSRFILSDDGSVQGIDYYKDGNPPKRVHAFIE
ncbi:MAG: DUF4347 domain-containing protein [Methanobacteriota archaeon]|nr:MAG: DUF4347 domain-containing protein [Euryarchaeota archaeon]